MKIAAIKYCFAKFGLFIIESTILVLFIVLFAAFFPLLL